jgi:hypothetical protein
VRTLDLGVQMIVLAKGKSTQLSALSDAVSQALRVLIDAEPETDIIREMTQPGYGIIPGAGIS